MSTRTAKGFGYRGILVVIAFIMVMLLILSLFFPEWHAAIGISSRLIFAVFCSFMSLWLLRERGSRLGAALVMLVGIGLVVTALLGYGFNGTPPQPWLFR